MGDFQLREVLRKKGIERAGSMAWRSAALGVVDEIRRRGGMNVTNREMKDLRVAVVLRLAHGFMPVRRKSSNRFSRF